MLDGLAPDGKFAVGVNDHADDDLNHFVLWREIKVQIKLLRKDRSSEGG